MASSPVEAESYSRKKELEEESFCDAVQLVVSSALTMSMHPAIELGVFDIIAKAAGLTSSEIAAQIGTKNPEASMMLDRILRLLTTHSVLNCYVVIADDQGSSFQRLYSLSPACVQAFCAQ